MWSRRPKQRVRAVHNFYINLFHVPNMLSNRQNISIHMGMKQIPLKLLQIQNNSKACKNIFLVFK